MEPRHIFGGKLKTLRLQQGLTQERLAELTDLSVETISNIERGVNFPGLETLHRLGIALGVHLATFYEWLPSLNTVSDNPERVQLEATFAQIGRSLGPHALGIAVEQIQVHIKQHQGEADLFGKLSDRIQALHEEGAEYDKVAMAATTLKTYGQMWGMFERWCAEYEVAALPASPEVIAVYAADLARRLKASSIHVHLSAIGYFHREAQHISPNADAVVRRRMRGIRRKKGMTPMRKTPLLLDDVDRALDLFGRDLRAARNRALLMVTWAAALRRSEACGLDVGPGQGGRGYVTFTAQGMELTIAVSKTDQEGKGRVIAIPLRRYKPDKCPVRLLRAWLDIVGITEGPIFRSVNCYGKVGVTRLQPVSLCRMVKTAAERLGYDRAAFGGHSLRAGLVTQAINSGASVSAVQETTGHKQVGVLFVYVRNSTRYRDSALNSIPSW